MIKPPETVDVYYFTELWNAAVKSLESGDVSELAETMHGLAELNDWYNTSSISGFKSTHLGLFEEVK